MNEISKADWKLFREKVPIWQEAYIDTILKEYVKLITSDEQASTKFWNLDKRIKVDKSNPGIQMGQWKSEAIFDIANMISLGVITTDDLDGFSNDLKSTVQNMLNHM